MSEIIDSGMHGDTENFAIVDGAMIFLSTIKLFLEVI